MRADLEREATPVDHVAALRSELLRRKETRDLVDHPDVVQGLGSLVALYAPGGQWHTFQELRKQGRTIRVLGEHGKPGRHHERLVRVRDTLVSAGKALQELKTEPLAFLSLLPNEPKEPDAPPSLDTFMRYLAYVRKSAEERVNDSERIVQAVKDRAARERPNRGRAADPDRRRFLRGIEKVLSAGGIGTFRDPKAAGIKTFNEGKPTAIHVAVATCCFRAARPEEPILKAEVRRHIVRWLRAQASTPSRF